MIVILVDRHIKMVDQPWSWSYGNWIYN